MFLEIGDQAFKIGYLAFLDIELFLDLYFFSIEGVVFVGLLAGEVVDSFLVGFPFGLQFVGDGVEGAAQGFDPASSVLDLIFVLPQLPRSLSGLLGFPFLAGAFVLLELLERFIFFSFDIVLNLLDL